jgi:hypothetical protein
VSEHLGVGGHLVLCLANRNPGTDLGLSAQEELATGGHLSIHIDLETFFVCNPAAWRDTEEDENLLVFIPGPLGADVQLRAPKRLFRGVHVHQ